MVIGIKPPGREAIHLYLVHKLRMSGTVYWDFLKEKLFLRKPSNESEIRRMAVDLCREIEELVCRRVF